MMDMLWKVRTFIKEEDLLAAGDRVLVALSGGADSVCLLLVLSELAGEGGWEIRAMHVHHGLRGQEADRDEDFVRKLCGRLGVPLFVVHRDVAGYAREHGLSAEEAGRILRYQALEEYGKSWEKNVISPDSQIRIAVAHHQDDNVETILHHLLRGSGLRGLGGILPAQGNRIRPLLCVSRKEIMLFLRERRQDWCEDSTNCSTDYTRNRIRRELLPYMKTYINEGAAENILRSGNMFREIDRYLAGQAEAVWKQAGEMSVKNPCARIRCKAFLAQDPVIRSYLVRHMLDLTAPGQKDITARHFRQIEALAGKPSGSRCDLPGALAAKRDYEYLVVEAAEPETSTHRSNTGNTAMEISACPGVPGAGSKVSGEAVTSFTPPLPGAGSIQVGKMTLMTFPLISSASASSPAGSRSPVSVAASALAVSSRSSALSLTDLSVPGEGPGPDTGQTPDTAAFSPEKAKEIPKNQYTKWFDYDRIKDTLSIRVWRKGDYLTLRGGGRKMLNRFMIDEKISRDVRQGIQVLAEGSHVLWVIGYRISEYYKITDDTQAVLQADWNGGETDGREDTCLVDRRRGKPEDQRDSRTDQPGL